MASFNPANLQVQRLSPDATIPTKGSKAAAGYDLYASADSLIKAGGRAVVPTDLIIAVPPSTYGRVAPRSGLAVKHGINTGAGVIDEDYRGPVGVVLFNHSQEDFQGEFHTLGERLPQPTLFPLLPCL